MQKAAIRILLEAGEPDALKDACPVREGGAGKGLRGTSLVSYFTPGPQGYRATLSGSAQVLTYGCVASP